MEFTGKYIQLLKAKDKNAFESLYTQTWPVLFNFIKYKIRGNIHLAEDILSEVYCRAIEYSHTLTLTHNVIGWLFRIARSKIADYYRKMKRENKLIREQKAVTKHIDILNYFTNIPESAILDQEDRLIVQIGFSRLPDEYKKVLKAKYVADKSVNEIAAIVKKTPKAIENILYRARKLLKKEITKVTKEKIYFIRERGEKNAG